jgi:heme/copper-type cytochrome/quinol oxidase subunit 2
VILFRRDVQSLPYLNMTHHEALEWAWTMIPALILVTIASPSFALLYGLDEISNPEMTLKVVGHQWHWSYEYSDFLRVGDLDGQSYNFLKFSYTAVLVQEEDLALGAIRLLATDWQVILPARTHIRVLVTSADVLHS